MEEVWKQKIMSNWSDDGDIDTLFQPKIVNEGKKD